MKSVLLIFIILIVSCNNDDSKNIKMHQVFDDKNKLSNEFFLNTNNQKDSVEKIYSLGKLTREIFWNKGKIDSISNYKKNSFTTYEVIQDSVSYVFTQEKELVLKVPIDKNGRYYGTGIHYKDSIITGVSNFVDGQLNGLVIHFDDNGYPKLIGNLIDNSFYFGIQFYSSGKVKSLSVNNKENEFGIIYDYYENKIVKSKSELKDGLVDGVQYNYDHKGEIISKRYYNKGRLKAPL